MGTRQCKKRAPSTDKERVMGLVDELGGKITKPPFWLDGLHSVCVANLEGVRGCEA
jgi:hypothetical protein